MMAAFQGLRDTCRFYDGRLVFFFSLVIMLFSQCLKGTMAMPSYRFRMPNGGAVPCPQKDFEGCDADALCPGVGHNTCKGGTFPLNAFGAAFKDASFTWTAELCKADSDGDGLSNGQELGDPCCEYVAGENFEPNLPDGYQLSHPGFANSVGNAPKVTCEGRKETGVSKFDIDAWNPFNEGEEGFVKEFRIKPYTIPPRRTTYQDFAWSFPECADGQCHLVGAVAVIDNAPYLHHYILRGCGSQSVGANWDGDKIGRSSMEECDQELDSLGGWVPGRNPFFKPSHDTSQPMPNAAVLNVQIHFDNPKKVAGVSDTSGFKVFYVRKARTHSLGQLAPIKLSIDSNTVIPPGKKRHYLTTGCNVTGLAQPATLYEIGWHAHLIGSEMYMDVWKGGFDPSRRGFTIMKEPRWYFDDQYNVEINHRAITIENGDYIVNTCVYDSTSRTKDTRIGIETVDEMCWGTLSYYPMQPGAKCRGIYWTGDLNDGEDAHAIPIAHATNSGATVPSGLGNIETLVSIKECNVTKVRELSGGKISMTALLRQALVKCSGADISTPTCMDFLGDVMGCRCPHHEGADDLTEQELAEVKVMVTLASAQAKDLGATPEDFECREDIATDDAPAASSSTTSAKVPDLSSTTTPASPAPSGARDAVSATTTKATTVAVESTATTVAKAGISASGSTAASLVAASAALLLSAAFA